MIIKRPTEVLIFFYVCQFLFDATPSTTKSLQNISEEDLQLRNLHCYYDQSRSWLILEYYQPPFMILNRIRLKILIKSILFLKLYNLLYYFEQENSLDGFVASHWIEYMAELEIKFRPIVLRSMKQILLPNT